MLIKKVDQCISSNGIKVILYGRSGVGKTSQVKCLLDEGFKPLVISAESGLLSLSGVAADVVDISKDDNDKILPLEKRYERLRDVFNYLSTQKHSYDTIVLDSLTEINQCLLDHLKVKFPDAKDSLRMFGENSAMMTKTIKSFRDLNYNVVVIALESTEKDEVGKRYTTIDLIGKVAASVPQYFDEVLYLYATESGERKFLTSSTEKVIAKDRSRKLEQVEEANLGKLLKKIRTTK